MCVSLRHVRWRPTKRALSVTKPSGNRSRRKPNTRRRKRRLLYALELDGRDVELETVHTLAPYLVLPAGHRLAVRRRVRLAMLAQEPCVMFDAPSPR